MNRVLLGIAGALFVTSFPSAAQEVPSAAAAPEVKWVRGTITTIGDQSITVKVRDREMTFLVDENTRALTRAGATPTRAERAEGKPGPPLDDVFKAGEGVEVRYRGDRMYAVSVSGLPGTPAGATSEDEPAPRSRTVVGVVSAISGTSLTVKAKGEEWVFTIGSSTEVIGTGVGTAYRKRQEQGDTTAIFDFVRMSDTVRVTYLELDGVNYASEVRITARAKR